MFKTEMNNRLHSKYEKIIEHQKNGKYPVSTSNGIPHIPSMLYRTIRTTYADYDYNAGAYIIPSRHKDKIPDLGEYPHPLKLTTGVVFRNHIEVGNFRVDIGDSHDLIKVVNDTLAEAQRPEVVMMLDVVEEPTPRLIISNGHISVHCSRAIWDQEKSQLVAATLVTSAKMSLKAILATLATNSNETIHLSGVDKDAIHLDNAKRGFLIAPHKMQHGYASTIYHPVCGDPRQFSEPYFYTIGAGQPFIDRLQTALPWPIRDDWYDYIIENGKNIGLIDNLKQAGDFPKSFRVFTGTNGVGAGWEDVISAGISSGKLALNDDPAGEVAIDCECTPMHTCSACREASEYMSGNELPY